MNPIFKRPKNFLTLIVSFVVVALLSFSCEKVEPSSSAPENYPGDNYVQIFESFWNGMNNNYVFWSVDTTHWDRVYRKYKPLFSQLSLFNSVFHCRNVF